MRRFWNWQGFEILQIEVLIQVSEAQQDSHRLAR